MLVEGSWARSPGCTSDHDDEHPEAVAGSADDGEMLTMRFYADGCVLMRRVVPGG